MASLYKRATPFQVRLLRAVEGAVHNTAHAHPEFLITDKFARSIAKRAAGTISAQMPGSLARPHQRVSQDQAVSLRTARSAASHLLLAPIASSHCSEAKQGSSHRSRRSQEKAVSPLERRLLLFPLQVHLGKLARYARKAGDKSRLDTLVEIMKLLDRLAKDEPLT
jgi:hypothetical protein